MWFLFAIGSAVFAALTSILAKVGIDGVNSNLATAIRTAVVLVLAWGIVFMTGGQHGISGISRKSWIFLILSGGVNSNLATAIRTAVVLVLAWGIVFMTGGQHGISGISRKSWIFLILSGLATGASWLCYYRALQIGEVSKVVPVDKLSVTITLILAFVFLHEQFTIKSAVGAILITAGTLVMAL